MNPFDVNDLCLEILSFIDPLHRIDLSNVCKSFEIHALGYPLSNDDIFSPFSNPSEELSELNQKKHRRFYGGWKSQSRRKYRRGGSDHFEIVKELKKTWKRVFFSGKYFRALLNWKFLKSVTRVVWNAPDFRYNSKFLSNKNFKSFIPKLPKIALSLLQLISPNIVHFTYYSEDHHYLNKSLKLHMKDILPFGWNNLRKLTLDEYPLGYNNKPFSIKSAPKLINLELNMKNFSPSHFKTLLPHLKVLKSPLLTNITLGKILHNKNSLESVEITMENDKKIEALNLCKLKTVTVKCNQLMKVYNLKLSNDLEKNTCLTELVIVGSGLCNVRDDKWTNDDIKNVNNILNSWDFRGIKKFHVKNFSLKAFDFSNTIKSFEDINLFANRLTRFDATNFPNVKFLDLSFNQITFKHTDLIALKQLEVLKLKNNNFLDGKFPVLSGNSKLRELNIAECGLKGFPKELCKFHHLEKLVLSENDIHEMPNDFFELLKCLKVLKMKGCLLKALPRSIGCLKSSLKVLDIRWNRIDTLPKGFCELNLRKFMCYPNKFKYIPFNIYTHLLKKDCDSFTMNSIMRQLKDFLGTGKIPKVPNFFTFPKKFRERNRGKKKIPSPQESHDSDEDHDFFDNRKYDDQYDIYPIYTTRCFSKLDKQIQPLMNEISYRLVYEKNRFTRGRNYEGSSSWSAPPVKRDRICMRGLNYYGRKEVGGFIFGDIIITRNGNENEREMVFSYDVSGLHSNGWNGRGRCYNIGVKLIFDITECLLGKNIFVQEIGYDHEPK